MAIYRVQGPDGRVHRFEGPDGASPEEVEGFASQQFGGVSEEPPKPKPIGMDAQADFLRAEMEEADPFTRNLVAAGTALSNTWEGAKQLFGKANKEQLEANKIFREEAPVGAFAGDVAELAIPFARAGKTGLQGIKQVAKIAGTLGFLKPGEGEGQDEILLDKAKNAGVDALLAGTGQKFAEMGGQWAARRLADLARQKAINAPRDKTLAAALDAGLVVPPASVNPTFSNVVKESIGGKAATAQQASNLNEVTGANLMRKAVGLAPDDPLTSDALKTIRDQAFQQGYMPVRAAGTMPTDAQYFKALDNIVAANQGAARSFPTGQTPPVVDALQHLRVPGFDAGDAVDKISVLREAASKAYANGDKEMGKALKGAAGALEDQIERNLPQGSDVLNSFREARKLMAKTYDVEKTIVQGGGTPDIRKLGQMFQKNPNRLTDELRVLGAFANNFPKAVQPSKQVAGPGVSALNAFGGTALGGGGATIGGLIGGPLGAAVGATAAAAPFVARPAMRSYLMSARYQNALRDLYRLGLPERAALGLLDNAAVGLTVAGRDPFFE